MSAWSVGISRASRTLPQLGARHHSGEVWEVCQCGCTGLGREPQCRGVGGGCALGSLSGARLRRLCFREVGKYPHNLRRPAELSVRVLSSKSLQQTKKLFTQMSGRTSGGLCIHAESWWPSMREGEMDSLGLKWPSGSQRLPRCRPK